MLILPGEMSIHDLRGSVHVLGLRARGRIGAFLMVIQPVQVKAAWFYPIDNGLMVAARAAFERHEALVRGNNMHLHRVGQRRPDQEMAAAGTEVGRTERDSEIHNHLLYA